MTMSLRTASASVSAFVIASSLALACSSTDAGGGSSDDGGGDAAGNPAQGDASLAADSPDSAANSDAGTVGPGGGIVFSEIVSSNATTTDFPMVRYGGTSQTGQFDVVLSDSSLDGTNKSRNLVTHISQEGHFPSGQPAPPLVAGMAYKIGNSGSDTTLYGYVSYEEFDPAGPKIRNWRSISGTVVVDKVASPIQFHVVDAKMTATVGSDSTGTFTLNFSGHLP